MPADITVGLYFPWLDYKWGFSTGVPVKNPLPSDIPSLLYPWRLLVIENLKNHTWPLWNPFYFGGMPLLANFQSATFSWTNLFFFFLPFAKAWGWGVVVQPFLTILFTFLFLRHLKINKTASLLGGIIFAFSAFSLIWLEYNVHGHAAMWLPLLLLSVDQIVEKRKFRWVLAGSFFLALSIFAGYPQIVLYSLTAVGFYALFRLVNFYQQEKNWRKIVVPFFELIVFVFLGVLLSAIQWLPGYEALKLSVREIDPIASLSSGGFLPWQNLVTFLSPDFFGNPATYNFWGKPWYDNFALYVGILPLILATLAVFLRRDKLSYFFTFLALFSFLIALPTPIAKIVEALGIYGVKAISARIIFLLDFSLAILAALGLDWFLSHFNNMYYRSGKRKILVILAVFTIVFITLWGFVLTAGKIFPEAKWLVYLKISQRNLILPTLLFLISSLIFGCWFLFKNRQTANIKVLVLIAILLLSVFDLFRFGWKYLSFSKQEMIFPSTPVIEFLQKQEKPFRVEFGETIPQNMWLPYGLESAAGYDAMAPLRYTQFLGALRTGKSDAPYGRVGQVENYESKLFDLLNIKYVLAVKYDEKGVRTPEGKPKPIFENPKFKLVFEDKTVQVYENKNVLPRAFLVHEVVVKNSDKEIIDQLLDSNFDLAKAAVIEENVSLGKTKFNLKNDKVLYFNYGQTSSFIKTNSEADGFLLVTDSFYPGWEAKIDGQPAKIYRTDFAFRGIFVPQGEHLIEFIYQPLSFRLGSFISLSTAVIMIGIIIVFFSVKTAPEILKKIFNHEDKN